MVQQVQPEVQREIPERPGAPKQAPCQCPQNGAKEDAVEEVGLEVSGLQNRGSNQSVVGGMPSSASISLLKDYPTTCGVVNGDSFSFC